MAPPNRTYSDFFSSGLRAMAGSSYRRPFSGRSSPAPENLLKISLTRRPRTSSSPTPAFIPSENATPLTRKQRRRSSIIALPSRLLDRISKSPDGWTPPAENYHIPSSYEKRAIVDPFDASPNSTSFFVDSIEPSTAPSPIQRPKSFLFLGDSTESVFRLSLPLVREHRPTSVRSMPLPSPSRRSSGGPPVCDKYDDRSWALEEEEESIWIDEIVEDDPAATIDWRQFHNDLLGEGQ